MAGPTQPAFVQGTAVNFATSQTTLAPALSGVVAGNTLILAVSSSTITSGYIASTVSDTNTGTWLRGQTLAFGSGGVDIWYCIKAGAGTHTLTVTLASSSTSGCELDEFSGVATVAPIIDAITANTGTSTTVSAGTLSPSNLNELLYFATVSANTQTVSPSSPFVARTGPTNGGNQKAGVAYVAGNALVGASYTPTWTQTNGTWLGVCLSLKGAQPISDAPFNDPAAQNNAAVLTAQSRPDYEDFVFDALAAQGTGILSGCAVSPNTNSDFKFQVAAGTALLNWGPITVAAATAQTVTAADGTNPRRDLVYVTQAGTVTYLAGTANATPCPPSLPPNCVPLAAIDVPASATTLDNGTGTSTAKVLDKRPLLVYAPSMRDTYLASSGALAETVSRLIPMSNTGTLSSGTLAFVAIVLPAGLTIGHIAFASCLTAASTPTHWWFTLHDSSRGMLAATADQTTTAWAAKTLKSLAIATTKEGAASTYTTTYGGVYFLGIMVTASATPTLCAVTQSGNSDAVFTPSPNISANTQSTSQTTVPAFPFTFAVSGIGDSPIPYAYVAV